MAAATLEAASWSVLKVGAPNGRQPSSGSGPGGAPAASAKAAPTVLPSTAPMAVRARGETSVGAKGALGQAWAPCWAPKVEARSEAGAMLGAEAKQATEASEAVMPPP
jgi:hypothetical protein